MDKKDIYEHLAKIYLDASSKRKKKGKEYTGLFRNLFIGASSLAVILLLALILPAALNRNPKNAEIALVLAPDAVKINFHFDPARKECYNIPLNQLDISKYKALAFSVKKVRYSDTVNLRVEFVNQYKEKSETYLQDIPSKWEEFRIELFRFKGISDWSHMRQLSFVIEEWNAKDKRGVVFVDNIRFIK